MGRFKLDDWVVVKKDSNRLPEELKGWQTQDVPALIVGAQNPRPGVDAWRVKVGEREFPVFDEDLKGWRE